MMKQMPWAPMWMKTSWELALMKPMVVLPQTMMTLMEPRATDCSFWLGVAGRSLRQSRSLGPSRRAGPSSQGRRRLLLLPLLPRRRRLLRVVRLQLLRVVLLLPAVAVVRPPSSPTILPCAGDKHEYAPYSVWSPPK